MAILSTVKSFLDGEGVGFEMSEEEGSIRFSFSGDTETWMVYIHDLEDSERLAVLSVVPTLVMESERAEVGNFIQRCNFGLVVGNFEMDLDSGEVRFRTSMDLDGITTNTDLVRNLVFGNVAVVNDYLPGLNRVIHGGLSAKEAIALVEGEDEN